MLSKYKYLIIILAVIVFLVPKPALALWGVGDFGLFDIPDQILGGIEEKTGPIFTAVTTLLIAYMAGLAALSITGEYLQQFISQQDSMITALEPMTRAGWNFTAGLSNMLLVLIFLVIAFAFIFKIETLQAKKALPKLIVVALLINFSFLFVQMLIDLSQILYNTVLPETPLFSMVMEVLISPGESVIATIIAWVAAMGISLAIPMVNAFIQILISTLFTVFLLPNIIIWIIQAIFFWALAAMFFLFIFIFAARVFILQMLMILAPLAFVCLILPKTEKFWQEWFSTLTQWLLSGVFFLFFLVLGFGTLSLMRPSVDSLPLPGAPLFKLGGFLVYYFVVFIYMAVILGVGKKFIPEGAKALIDFGKGIASTVVTRGLAPMGKQAKSTNKELKADLKGRAANRAERIGQKKKSGEKLTRGERITAWNLRRKGGGSMDQGIELAKAESGLEQRKLVNDKKRSYAAQTKNMDEEGQKAFYNKELLRLSATPKALRRPHATAALMELASDVDAVDGKNKKTKGLSDEAIAAGGKTTSKKIFARNPQWAPDEVDGDHNAEGTLGNVIATMNPADIDRLSKTAKQDPRVIGKIVETKQENLINRLGSQNKAIRDSVQTAIDTTTGGNDWKTTVDKLIADKNPQKKQEATKILSLLKNFHTSQAATNIGWKQYGTLEEIENKAKEISGTTPAPKSKITTPGEKEFREKEKEIRDNLNR